MSEKSLENFGSFIYSEKKLFEQAGRDINTIEAEALLRDIGEDKNN